MSTDKLITAEAIAAPKPKKATGPRDPRMVRIGGIIAIAGFIPAIVCAAILGAQPGGSNPIVEWIHRGALFIILAGFLVILFGVIRFERFQERYPGLRFATPGAFPRSATSKSLPWILGFITFLVFAVALLTFVAVIGLPLLGLLGVMLLPAPMLLIAIYGPPAVRPFFVCALFPTLILLAVDCLLLTLFALEGFERRGFGRTRDEGIVLLHLVGGLLIPVFGFGGRRVVEWIRSLDETTRD